MDPFTLVGLVQAYAAVIGIVSDTATVIVSIITIWWWLTRGIPPT